MNSCCCKDDLIKRLKRIEGQIRGISNMIEEDRECEDIIVQMSAVDGALRSVSKEFLKSHLNSCVKESIKDGSDEKLNNFNLILDRFIK